MKKKILFFLAGSVILTITSCSSDSEFQISEKELQAANSHCQDKYGGRKWKPILLNRMFPYWLEPKEYFVQYPPEIEDIEQAKRKFDKLSICDILLRGEARVLNKINVEVLPKNFSLTEPWYVVRERKMQEKWKTFFQQHLK